MCICYPKQGRPKVTRESLLPALGQQRTGAATAAPRCLENHTMDLQAPPPATLKRMDHPPRIQVAVQLSSRLVPWAPHNAIPDVLPSTLSAL